MRRQKSLVHVARGSGLSRPRSTERKTVRSSHRDDPKPAEMEAVQWLRPLAALDEECAIGAIDDVEGAATGSAATVGQVNAHAHGLGPFLGDG